MTDLGLIQMFIVMNTKEKQLNNHKKLIPDNSYWKQTYL